MVCKLSRTVIVYHVWNVCTEVAISLILLPYGGEKMTLEARLFVLDVLILCYLKLMGGETQMFLINTPC